jgi:hypothetical protein
VIARTQSAAVARPIARRSASVLFTATAALLLGGVVLAAPAAAVDDPSTPDAHVTHGPSCRPGGVVVEVIGGTVDYEVTLATTRSPGGEDFAVVPAGATVELRTGDVDWAETIDGRLEYTALDGSGTSFVDELAGYTFTRPAEEDCAAIAAPAAVATVPPVQAGTDVGTTAPDAAPDGVRPDGTRPGGTDVAPAPAAGRVIAPGAATPVDLIETAAAPAGLTASTPLAPLVVAAVALVAAVAGMVGVLGRSRRAVRQPTGSA